MRDNGFVGERVHSIALSTAVMTNLRALAKEVGCSISTASYALRGRSRVSVAMRLKIQRAAKRLGYRPSALNATVAAQLKAANPPKRGGAIACLACWKELARDLNPSANELFLRGARDRAASLGWQLVEIPYDYSPYSGTRLGKILSSRGIDGLIVGSLPWYLEPIQLGWQTLAAAAWGYSLHEPLLHRASVHHAHCLTLAAGILQERGFTRVGLAIPAISNIRSDNLWEAAYRARQKSLPSNSRIPPFMPTNWAEEAFREWYRAYRPDAVLTNKPIRPWLARLGKEASRTAIVDLDRTAGGPSRAGMDLRHGAVGAATVDLVVGQFNSNERGIPSIAKLVLIEGEWIDGPYVGPA